MNNPDSTQQPSPAVAASRVSRVLPVILILATAVVLLGAARLWGPWLRDATLLSFETSPVESFPAYSDAPAAATGFFEGRDSAAVTVSRDMTLSEFLALYHLSNNQAARAALRDQLGVEAEGDELREGTRVVLPLSPEAR